jgi:hypothetical protein
MPNAFVGGASFKYPKARPPQRIPGHQSDERVIIDDEYLRMDMPIVTHAH